MYFLSFGYQKETWMSAKKAVSEGFVDGMLYTENKEEDVTEPVENAFMFSRFAIQNSVKDSTRNFIEQYNKRFKESHKDEEKTKLLKSKLALECEL